VTVRASFIVSAETSPPELKFFWLYIELTGPMTSRSRLPCRSMRDVNVKLSNS